MTGIAVGLNKGHVVTKREISKPKTRASKRGAFVRGLIREVAGFSPYEKRIMELLKVGKDKRALKLAKRKLGTHRRAKVKREEMQTALRKMSGPKRRVGLLKRLSEPPFRPLSSPIALHNRTRTPPSPPHQPYETKDVIQWTKEKRDLHNLPSFPPSSLPHSSSLSVPMPFPPSAYETKDVIQRTKEKRDSSETPQRTPLPPIFSHCPAQPHTSLPSPHFPFCYALKPSAYETKDVIQWTKEKREEIRERPKEGLDGLITKGLNAAVDVAQWYVDTRADVEERIHKFNQPASDRLLPDLTPQEAHVYTLVLDLEGTLVHSEWKRDRGWRTFKRPGAEAFLERMAQFFEVVVFSDQLNLSVDPILDRLDQKGCIRYRLYRDGTLYTDGNYVRDLTKLNRDPNKVIYISSLPESVLQKENLVPLSAWKDTGADTALLDLLPFLECVARQRPADIRVVLQSYEGQDIPTAFKERSKLMQKQLQERKQHGIFRFARGGS
ncbi:unnamed protein product [Closterium sp. NIES-65]|nr:unnamed protein product [Closterium sp. NIES-65]